MRHTPWLAIAFFVLAVRPAVAQTPPEKKFPDFDKVVGGAKEYDGLFKIYQKDDKLFAEIKPEKLNKPLLFPIAIAKGAGLGGFTLNFDEQWVLLFRKVSDTKLHLIRRNVHFQARPGSPVARAVETTYTDSVLLAISIATMNPKTGGIIIDLGDIFMSDFGQLGIGSFDRSRSTWHKVKAFPNNIEIQVAATYSLGGGRFGRGGDDSVIDPRGTTLIIHYGLVELPETGYQPRHADPRVGYFLSAHRDFSSDNKETSFVRYVNRWRLERADTDPKNKARLSVPKKKIIFWIEKSVPFEYRGYVRDGILEWNKAFEKIGFRDAIEVRQQESEDFDPEDVNYCTFRWIATGQGFAMGPSRANPLTGEILDADIIFDADMVRYFKREAKMLGANSSLTWEDLPSPIQAHRYGFALPESPLPERDRLSWDLRQPKADAGLGERLWAIRQGVCQCGPCMKYELGMAAMAFAARDQIKPGEGLPEELVGQAVKMVVMHEVGHTLGLRHNFKSSNMLKNDQLHDVNLTRKLGLAGSVMDYMPINLAPKGVKQGDFFMTTIGPYDYWAIEYGYKPLDGGTEGEAASLQEIASRGAKAGHDYGTDEDLAGTSDPLINPWDLGNDSLKFSSDRMLLASELMKSLADKSVDKGEGYQRVRQSFGILLNQYGNGAFLVSQYIGGVHAHRDHKGDPSGRDPMVPVTGKRQREALVFAKDHLLTDKYFQFPPELLRRLAADRWMHWGSDAAFMTTDYPIHDRVLGIQRVVLNHLTDAGVMRRIQANAASAPSDDQPLTLAETFRTLTQAIWEEYPVTDPAKKNYASNVMRRNLQREHLQRLTNMILGPRPGNPQMGMVIFFGPSSSSRTIPPDARSLARLHLREIEKRIGLVVEDKNLTLDDTTRAHLEESRERIARALSAAVQMNEP